MFLSNFTKTVVNLPCIHVSQMGNLDYLVTMHTESNNKTLIQGHHTWIEGKCEVDWITYWIWCQKWNWSHVSGPLAQFILYFHKMSAFTSCAGTLSKCNAQECYFLYPAERKCPEGASFYRVRSPWLQYLKIRMSNFLTLFKIKRTASHTNIHGFFISWSWCFREEEFGWVTGVSQSKFQYKRFPERTLSCIEATILKVYRTTFTPQCLLNHL